MTREELRNETINLLEKYEIATGRNYQPTTEGVNAMLDVWEEEKCSLIEAMSRHPNYNGRYQIVLDESFARKIDKSETYVFANFLCDNMKKFVTHAERIIPTEKECRFGFCHDMEAFLGVELTVESDYGDNSFGVYENDFRWDGSYCELILSEEGKMSYSEFSALKHFIWQFDSQYLENEQVDEVNERFPWAKIHYGAKTSRTILKICRHYEIDKLEGFNQQYTRYADAVNPLNVTRWTIISVHPVDYLTMSFGNSWASCHTIDKTNIRNMPSNYEGMYSGGTQSYMLDGTSVVVYIVDKSYKGDHFELEPKINRQMFHIGAEKIVQGRLYPQDNDSGSEEMYKQLREIVQRVFSQCFGWNNLWTVSKGTEACNKVIQSSGVHYRDYAHYSNCNVSFLKREDDSKNYEMIKVGHSEICPECGSSHYRENCIVCDECSDGNMVTCNSCGASISQDDDDYISIDGDLYYCCPECAEREGYRYCDDGCWHHEDDSDVLYDDYLGEWCYDPNGYWEDRVKVCGYVFTCPEHANEYGFYYCSECGEWVSEENYDFDLDMCDECASMHREEELA